jgi:SAM-dependent methyltransferase
VPGLLPVDASPRFCYNRAVEYSACRASAPFSAVPFARRQDCSEVNVLSASRPAMTAAEQLVASPETKWINLGHPSYVWRFGQERRLSLIRRYVPLNRRRILDVGCGIGTYVRRFRDFTDDAYGVDIDREKVEEASRYLPNISVAPAEELPFPDGDFDVVLLHEVLEHVVDDSQAVLEAARVLRPGGHLVIFAPNRLYPFETHGIYLGRRYVFRLVPFVNYLPDRLRRFFCPHVRAYTAGDLRKLLERASLKVTVQTCIYPGFDNIAARHPAFGNLLRRLLYFAEGTWLCRFGLSHFIVAAKLPSDP